MSTIVDKHGPHRQYSVPLARAVGGPVAAILLVHLLDCRSRGDAAGWFSAGTAAEICVDAELSKPEYRKARRRLIYIGVLKSRDNDGLQYAINDDILGDLFQKQLDGRR